MVLLNESPRSTAYLIVLALIALLCSASSEDAIAQAKKKKGGDSPKTEKKAAKGPLDPYGRPDVPLAAKFEGGSARYFLWYDSQGWHVRTTAPRVRRFKGTISVDGGTIASAVPAGLKEKQKLKDAYRVGADRKQLNFEFVTGSAADGFDFRIEGDEAELSFDLTIEGQSRPRAVFIGRDQGHPAKIPFTLPAKPEKVKKAASK